jgi:hypothetical protein
MSSVWLMLRCAATPSPGEGPVQPEATIASIMALKGLTNFTCTATVTTIASPNSWRSVYRKKWTFRGTVTNQIRITAPCTTMSVVRAISLVGNIELSSIAPTDDAVYFDA